MPEKHRVSCAQVIKTETIPLGGKPNSIIELVRKYRIKFIPRDGSSPPHVFGNNSAVKTGHSVFRTYPQTAIFVKVHRKNIVARKFIPERSP